MKKFLFFLLFFCHLSAASDHPIVMVIGTRPEAIKMAPVYHALKKEGLPVLLCSSGQHEELLNEVLDLFEMKPDVEFKIMKPGQDLFHITEAVLSRSKQLFQMLQPSLVIVQGDTTTALAAAMAAFYLKIPVAHVEAGLRSGNRNRPFPEEMNRMMITLLTTYHFAPTKRALETLLAERVDPNAIYYTGNTVVDALYSIRDKLNLGVLQPKSEVADFINEQVSVGRKTVLLTAHRRESFESGLFHIFTAIKEALERYPNLSIIYPIHPNPAIEKVLKQVHLDESPRIKITKPLGYKDLVWVLNAVDGVATDSGGIQEEATSLSKLVLVLREETDRPEAIEEGVGFLVGTDEEKILNGIEMILTDLVDFSSRANSVYGDGQAATRIAQILKTVLRQDE